jgi:hypothetical protein
MAEYGEWNRKGATLSEVTAQSEYGVSSDFIIKGIRTGKLEYRDGAIWGNPYLRVLRSQIEAYIAEEMGAEFLQRTKNQAELSSVKKEINSLTKQLKLLEIRKNVLELSLKTTNNAEQPASDVEANQSISVVHSLKKETKS